MAHIDDCKVALTTENGYFQNELGQTLLHLAAVNGKVTILNRIRYSRVTIKG